MSVLFQIRGNLVQPNAETLLISPFREIWERDRSKDKARALEDFAFVEFCTSVEKSNPFAKWPDDIREEVVRKEIIRSKDWEKDGLVEQAMEKAVMFQEQSSTIYRYYMSAKAAVEKVADFLNKVDLNERNAKTGALLYKPADITRALNDLEKNMANLKALEKKVEEEVFDGSKNRGDKQVSPFAEAF